MGGILAGFIGLQPVHAEVGWELFQTSRFVGKGGQYMWVTPSGLKTTESTTGLNVVMRAPSWEVIMYNDQTKKFHKTNMQQWVSTMKQRKGVPSLEGATWKRGRQGVVAGQPAFEFIVDKFPQFRQPVSVKGKTIKKVPNKLATASFWVAGNIAVPTQVSQMIAKFYGVPDSQRVPLRLVTTDIGKTKPEVQMDTIRVRQFNVPDSLFSVPRGYTQTRSEAEVFLDQESADTLNDLLKDL